MIRIAIVRYMRFYVTRTADGLVHVQNSVMGMLGQHHVHTPKGYAVWASRIEKEAIVELEASSCTCGLGPGDVREHDGKRWHKEAFE